MATPAGVPVLMTSPGYSTMNWLTYWTSSATPNFMFAVLPSCFCSPLTHSRSASACGSGTSSAVTSQGPNGLNVSQFFPLSHWPCRSIWNSRSDTSLTTAYPPTQASASACDPRYRAVRPITTASSTSQSVLTLRRGMSTSSNGPTTVSAALRNTTGSVGSAAPVSAAWSW